MWENATIPTGFQNDVCFCTCGCGEEKQYRDNNNKLQSTTFIAINLHVFLTEIASLFILNEAVFVGLTVLHFIL